MSQTHLPIGIKLLLSLMLYLPTVSSKAQAPNLVIITIDGLRWQELYMGLDTVIVNNKLYNQGDSIGLYSLYNKQPIMPFVSKVMGKQGQLWGNRNAYTFSYNNNPYWFSYPGYSELLCGFVDTAINTNKYTNNPHHNLLDYLQNQSAYHNKVVAFGAWFAFDRILHKPTATYPIYSAFTTYVNTASPNVTLLNKLNNETFKPFGNEECLDVFTHNMALDYIKTNQPKVMYIAYGETDEWAHEAHYKYYLNAARQTNLFIKELWTYMQRNNFYKNNTILLVTCDHGRGEGNEWISHNSKTEGSNQTWFALMGKGVQAKGVVANGGVVYQQQLAQTVAQLLGLVYTDKHTVSPAITIK